MCRHKLNANAGAVELSSLEYNTASKVSLCHFIIAWMINVGLRLLFQMSNEKSILNKLQLLASSLNARLFRNNNGLAYSGIVVSKSFDTITLKNPRPIKYGLGVGTGDLFGGTQITITPDMVGRKVFVVTNYEVKTKNTKTSKEQLAFHNMVLSLGGISIIDRFDDDSIEGNSYRESIDKFQGTI